ncbi:MAG: putative nucleotidyltransferase substrate binding domain-containing protein [Burkholderiales bacterium]
MQIELAEIRDFLAAHRPFDELPGQLLDSLPSQMSVRYLRRGLPFPPPDADAHYLYIVRQGAVEIRDRGGELIDKLGEGDLHAQSCSDDAGAAFSAAASEDTLLYLLPCEGLQALRSRCAAFDACFTTSVTERLAMGLAVARQTQAGGGSLMRVRAGELIGKPPVCVTRDASIRSAARLMTEQRVSSVLVVDGDLLLGLITDRDLRSRCIAAGISYDRPVQEIMTTAVHTIAPATPGFEALMTMTRMNVHHLPVTDGQRVRGMITATDLIRHESANAVYLVGDIHKADSVEALAAASQRLPELQIRLVFAGATASHLGEAVSAVTDALTVRLIELAERDLGPAPVGYAWVAGGSQARREQTAHSDQDNALIIDDTMKAEDGVYFERLAWFVNDGLNRCGFIYCPGDVMASNTQWRQPLRQWRAYFDRWIGEPEPMALMLSSVFFDLRVVHGEHALLEELQTTNQEKTRANGIFLAYMSGNALKNAPPLGFFRNLVLVRGGEHDRTLDLKRRGVVPVVDLARVYALAEGISPVNTRSRLRATAQSRSVSGQGARDLEDAFEFIGTLRAQHQARQLRAGQAADNYLAPDELSSLERSHLKDAFGVIATLQDALAKRFPTGRFI